jgi:hypothetical protein
MRAGATVLHFAVDVALVLRDGAGGYDAGSVDDSRDDGRRTFDGDNVAGIDGQHRLHGGEKVANVHRFRARHERMLGSARRRDARGRDEQQRAGDGA